MQDLTATKSPANISILGWAGARGRWRGNTASGRQAGRKTEDHEMVNPKEIELMQELKRRCGNTWNQGPGFTGYVWPRQLIAELDIPPRQAWRWLEKWCRRGWYSYGSTIDLGWLEKEAFTDPKSPIANS